MSANRVAAAAVIAVAAVLFALTFGFEKMPLGLSGGFGAEAFPRLVLGVVSGLAVLLFLAGPASEPPAPIAAMVYYTAASLLAFMALVPLVGMLGAMFLLLVGLGYLWGERRAWLLLLICASVMVVIWGVFVKGFAVQLPQGLWS
ncbi:MAG TPA: tripartite tricarboxylate transporter TctB family protein [Burkholderiales bacterium]|nr:tripartite tricarboxylate transporter TctB family protein [Burkholderiales bacterium]